MLRIPCPKCHNSSYTTYVESFNSCSYCGLMFSGKYGPDRRHETRMEQEIPFSLSYNGQNFKGSTFDYSKNGVGIKISGELPMAVGETLNLKIGGRPIMTKVMWIKKMSDRALAGLSKLLVSP